MHGQVRRRAVGLLIAARLVQGVAGGMLIPQNSGLIQELFQGAERGGAFGLLGSTIGLARQRPGDRRADPGNSRPGRLALGVLRERANRPHRAGAGGPAPASHNGRELARNRPRSAGFAAASAVASLPY